MKNLAISRRYAKALLLIGKEDDLAEKYREELGAFVDLLKREHKLMEVLQNPLYNAAERRSVLDALLNRLSLSPVIRSYLLLIFDKKRFPFIESIYDFYFKMVDELKGVARARLTAAAELPEDTIDKVRAALSTRTGKDIILDVEQDPALIGGIIAQMGDLVLDGSIRTQLRNMRETLKRGESR